MVDPLSYFLFQVCSTTGIKGCGVCYPVCGTVCVKEHLRLTKRVAHVVAVGFLSPYVTVVFYHTSDTI